MYDKTETFITDRRELLRVKVKSLVEEAKIIRREEDRINGALRDELHLHRIVQVRREARAAHVAYGLIKGRTLDQMERIRRTEPEWSKVSRLLKKYGPKHWAALVPVPAVDEPPRLAE